MTTPVGAGTPQGATPKRSVKMASNQSLNHLLNFTLPPRQTPQYHDIPARRRKTGGNQHGFWNKERFINAQYRFIMNPTGDYTVHFADPDIYFQWHDILQVIVPRTSAVASAAGSEHHVAQAEGLTTCPICLSPPTAPRMTKCGHVFCFPCILHYLSTSDNLKWIRCPICFDSVTERQLKAVKWFDGVTGPEDEEDAQPEASSSSATTDNNMVNAPTPGTLLRMRLIQRPSITTLALPRSHTWPSDVLPPLKAPFHFLPDILTFSKFMLATPASLISDLTKDLDDLALERRSLASMQDGLGVAFVEAADAKVRHQIEKATALDTPHLRAVIESATLSQRQLSDIRRGHEDGAVQPLADAPEAFLATLHSGSRAPKAPSVSSVPSGPSERTPTPSRGPRQRKNLNPPPPSTSAYYYYQAASGLPIYLHPLDIKILLSNFSHYAAFPDTITVRVESFAESTVDEDLRKRCKYLAHLPEGADVVFIEADLEGVVGQDGLKNFERALSMRRSRRDQKNRKDDKARARAEERDKERLLTTWNEMHRGRVDAYIATPVTARSASPPDVESPPADQQPPPIPQGAWGNRSFASAAQAPATPGQRPARRNVEREADEWDLDVAFHELEARNTRGSTGGGGGGGKRKNTRLVVLGSGGGGRRR
ncbi:hypothetical protein BXZ70DRAFT_943220 [Cristinia sonorae]|uniref:RING-type domain-containing protein n=1 Tax=Cristinia sonorae TaxID=1940300 RepID=A0A8K0UNB8_9AGAR|nr:hypothetical protein BXZ70DRAFT_943220 [Cristinia sonorae]